MNKNETSVNNCPKCGSVCISQGWLNPEGKNVSRCTTCEHTWDPSQTNVITISLPDNWCASQEGQSDRLILKSKYNNSNERIEINLGTIDWNWNFSEAGRILIHFGKE